jgi:hypothetical protein
MNINLISYSIIIASMLLGTVSVSITWSIIANLFSKKMMKKIRKKMLNMKILTVRQMKKILLAQMTMNICKSLHKNLSQKNN